MTASHGKLTLWLHHDDVSGVPLCGKKIATLPTHLPARVTCFAADANVMVAGYLPGMLQVRTSLLRLRCRTEMQNAPNVEDLSRNQSCQHHLRALHLLHLQRRLQVRPAAAVPVLPGGGVGSFLPFSLSLSSLALVPHPTGWWGLASDSGTVA